MKDRLLLFLKRENISATSLADEIGVQRSSISHILSGRNNPSYDFILKLLSRYGSINAEWLLTGKGDMYKKEQQIIPGRTEEEQPGETEQKNVIQKVTNVNKLEKIVHFYKNGTFKEYNPSE